MQQFVQEEKCIREENIRLQRKLQAEVERREALCRHLSESESSLEMDEERFYNENFNLANHRQRTISSPVPHSPSSSRPLSPGATMPTTSRCHTCGQYVVSINRVQIQLFSIVNVDVSLCYRFTGPTHK